MMEHSQMSTGLLVMDMQAGILGQLNDRTSFLERVEKAIKACRKNNIPVIYVVVGFRKGTPEINKNNKAFTASRDRWANADPETMMKIDPKIAPQQNEIIITKRRISAFTGSDLEVVLRSQGIQHIVLTGIATSGVVLSTLREAADKDYRLTVLSDGCFDMDEEVHRVLTTKIFPRQADVMTVEEWSSTL